MEKQKRVRWYNNPDRCEVYINGNWFMDASASCNILDKEIRSDKLALVKIEGRLADHFFFVRQKRKLRG